jgi:hypothetical protein
MICYEQGYHAGNLVPNSRMIHPGAVVSPPLSYICCKSWGAAARLYEPEQRIPTAALEVERECRDQRLPTSAYARS